MKRKLEDQVKWKVWMPRTGQWQRTNDDDDDQQILILRLKCNIVVFHMYIINLAEYKCN